MIPVTTIIPTTISAFPTTTVEPVFWLPEPLPLELPLVPLGLVVE